MGKNRVIYNSETGEVDSDNADSRAYKLPNGFGIWWVIGYFECPQSKFEKYVYFSVGIKRINELKKANKREMLSVEKVKYLWEVYGYLTQLTDKGVSMIEKII